MRCSSLSISTFLPSRDDETLKETVSAGASVDTRLSFNPNHNRSRSLPSGRPKLKPLKVYGHNHLCSPELLRFTVANLSQADICGRPDSLDVQMRHSLLQLDSMDSEMFQSADLAHQSGLSWRHRGPFTHPLTNPHTALSAADGCVVGLSGGTMAVHESYILHAGMYVSPLQSRYVSLLFTDVKSWGYTPVKGQVLEHCWWHGDALWP